MVGLLSGEFLLALPISASGEYQEKACDNEPADFDTGPQFHSYFNNSGIPTSH